MKSFYGGAKGENYVVSHIFSNRQSLFNDLAQGVASPVGLNEIVMVSYGNYNSDEYEMNLGIDSGLETINPFYFTHNPFLHYDPSDKAVDYETKYDILDSRYGGSYNGIKNKQAGRNVWIQLLVQGKVSFNGNFIKGVTDSNPEKYWTKDTAIHCYIATSLEAAKNSKVIAYSRFQLVENYETDETGNFVMIADGTVPSAFGTVYDDETNEFKCFEATITGNDAGKPYYLFICVAPYTAVNFSTFSVTPSNPNSLFNYNSALFQKVLNTPQGILNPVVDVIHSDTNKYAYKFLTSSLGTTPQIEIDQTITILDYNESPILTKTEESTWDRTKYELQLPDQTQLKLSRDYKQLNIVGQQDGQEDAVIDTYKFPEFSAKYEEGNLVLSLKDLNTEQTQILTSVKTVPSFRITVLEGENVFENQYILQYKFSFEKDNAEWHNVIDSAGEPINLNFQGSLISTAELEDKSGYKIFIDNKDTNKDETIVIKHGDKGDTGKPLQISYSFNSKINSATEINFIDLSNEQQNNYIAEALNSQDIQFPYNLYDEDMEALRLNEAFMGNIIYNNANKNLENILVFYFNTGKYAVEGEISAIADNEFVSNKLIEDEDVDGNKIIKYQIISYSFLYFNNDITNTLIKNITSLDNQSLVLNTSDNYDPTDKIFGAEGLTAGETNKIGTKVFDIVGYEGTEGGEGYYVLSCDSEQQAADMLTDISAAIQEQKNKSKALKWSIKAGFCYDYAGNIIKVEEMKDENVLEISQEFQDFSFDSKINVGGSFYTPINNIDYTSLLNSNDLGTIIFNDDLNEKIVSIEIKPLDNAYKYTWTTPNFIIVYEIGNITISKRNVDSNFNELTKITIQMNLQSNENTKKLKLTIDNFYSNAVLKGQESKYLPNSFKDTDRLGYYDCAPLGYYIEHQTNEGSAEATEGILYICGYPEIGTRELFGRSYSFGANNVSQQAFSFQSGYGNQGYNKYGITIGQANISGFGNAVFGRWNDIGFAQMNISQGDYNKIGNYAKYDAQFGLRLKSDYDHQYQFGRYNKNKENNIIEVGYGFNEANRNNIFEVDKEGKIYSNEMENMIDQKITIFADTSKIQLTNINPIWEKYPNYIGSEYLYDGGYDHYMTISSDCFEKNQRYLVEFCFQLKIEESGTLDFRELITGTGTKVEAFRNKYQTLNLEASDSLYTCVVTRFINPDEKDKEVTNIESYGIGIHNSSTAKIRLYHMDTKIRQIYYIDNLFNNYTKNLFINLKNINTIITGEQDIFSFINDKEYISYNDVLYLIPKEAIENYEIINTYIPSEFTQYKSQKWEKILNINPLFGKTTVVSKQEWRSLVDTIGSKFATNTKDFIETNETIQIFINEGYLNENTLLNLGSKIESKHKAEVINLIYLYNEFISLECSGLSENQDVLISFNPQAGITEENYNLQKENYNLIISNSYAKTFDNEVRIYIMNDEFIDSNNNISCPILIKVV